MSTKKENLEVLVTQMTCDFELGAVIGCIFLSIVLLCHHHQKHSRGPEYPDFIQDPYEQWFQAKDVCKVTTCSHEKFIVIFVLSAVIIFAVFLAQGCPHYW